MPDTAKHTPGPWELKTYTIEAVADEGNFQSQLCVKSPNLDICEVARIPQGNTHAQEDIANARLIAAAPELLDACKAVMIVLTGGGVISDSELEGWALELVLATRTAIAKAITKAGGGI